MAPALVDAFGDADSYSDAIAFVYGEMLTDIGRVASGGDSVTAPIWVRLLIGIVGAAVVLTSATLLFRPPRGDRTLGVPDEARVRGMLRDYGEWDSLGYFATRRDKAVVWDTDDPAEARAGVSHGVFGSVSLASGNPVGDPLRWPEAIERWRTHARAAGCPSR